MATYNQLAAIENDANWSSFSEKVRIACIIKAATIMGDVNATSGQKAWAIACVKDARATMQNIRAMIVAANQAATVAQITGATDAAIQTNVNTAADFFAANGG
jgi:endonuclease/exonuclease/phosphatase family metal-dependent hydrolase